ncbi:MAG: DUF3326 domain-containing protein [Leptolyngbya sp. SIO4C1]|nr:DUF3326 domain-containing protein [Leptolyngbya sp. SIO4C1]
MKPHTTVLIVPTGIGAAIGGYAGDALPVARAIAAVTDRLITHPNVLNGAQLYWPLPNACYVEGYGLDQFASGQWQLQLVQQNRIGLLLDAAIEGDLRGRHLQAADAARATLGLNLTSYVVTDQPLQVTLQQADSGATWGTLANPGSLLRAAERLVAEAGATAIAVVARFPDDTGSAALDSYRHGQGVDPLAGAEAVISHLIVRTFQIPCAHAPALSPLPLDPTISPRSAAEEIGHTFLPCVLAGLSRAPQFVTAAADAITASQVDAVILPATAFGGSAALSFSAAGATLIAVSENRTAMAAPPAPLGIKAVMADSYLEAIGILAAQRAGIDLSMLRSPIPSLQPLPPPPSPS